jgi:hypothetical protein
MIAADCFQRVSCAASVFQFGFVDLLFTAYIQQQSLLFAVCN